MEFMEMEPPPVLPSKRYSLGPLSARQWEWLCIAGLLMAALASRFIGLGWRGMSHDEVNHVAPAFDLYLGRGYSHSPVTHGPLQFHLLALSYFLFGDSDFSARIPAALFSVATIIAVLFLFRRYLGRTGALCAGLLFLVSPFMLFYGRYVRNEVFVALFGVLTLYAVLHYFEKGDHGSMTLLTLATALHFTTKETSYIYAAELLLFLGLVFLQSSLKLAWPRRSQRILFESLILLALLLLFTALGVAFINTRNAKAPAATPAAVTLPPTAPSPKVEVLLFGAAVIAGLAALVIMARALGWPVLRAQRSFDLLILIGTLVLPLLSAFPLKLLGWDPLDYSATGLIHTGLVVAALAGLAAGVGLWWQPRLWLRNAALFYGIFTVLYTTFFTNGPGFFSGLVGALGYWLAQQGVELGQQPLYYYALLQLPMYEYLPLIGTLLALYFALHDRRFATPPGVAPATPPADFPLQSQPVPTLTLLLYWFLISLVAFSLAGERMPWLTVHITLPLLLSAGWGLGYLIDTTPWRALLNRQGALALLLTPFFFASAGMTVGSLILGGRSLQSGVAVPIQPVTTLIVALPSALLSGWGIFKALQSWAPASILRLMVATFFAGLIVLTGRTAYRASFINYDEPTEYLLYAHGARGAKDLLAQIEEIGRRTGQGQNLVVAYDSYSRYPFWWYLRHYPNQRSFGEQPSRDLYGSDLIIVGESNYGKLDSIVKDDYIYFEYLRLVWPNQDYNHLTWERIRYALTHPLLLQAIFNIWLNRDYTLYAQVAYDPPTSVDKLPYTNRMRLYIRQDIASRMGYAPTATVPAPVQPDPYVAQALPLQPDLVIGQSGTAPGSLQAPRGLAIAPDGSLYVADSLNHRIQHFAPNGALLHVWGTFADQARGGAPGGTFNEPWSVAVAPDGTVYVADTWNYRVQRFTATGQFLQQWGHQGQDGSPDAFWGPRGIAVDAEGRVFVADTGNKRVVVFTANGDYLAQFGSPGVELGNLDEPVGIAVNAQGRVYVADTWNWRVQVFVPIFASQLSGYTPLTAWDIFGWSEQTPDNRAFVALDPAGNLYVTDPGGYRVLKFNADGAYLLSWGAYSTQADGFGLPAGVAVDQEGHVWISDAGNHRLLRFTLASATPLPQNNDPTAP